MQQPKTIMERLRAGLEVRVMTIGTFWNPKLVEMAGLVAQVEGMWFDQEHTAITRSELDLLTMACRAAGVDCFARVAAHHYTDVMRPYEAGCSGVMVAQVRELAEVEQAVSWAKFPPTGTRGAYPANIEADFGRKRLQDHIESANRDRWLAIQIETSEGVELAPAIAAMEGVDWLFVGPTDLSINLGVPGEYLSEPSLAAHERVAAACRAVGKPWGVLCPHVEHARKCRELGAQLFSLHSDTGCFRRGIRGLEAEFAEFFP